MRPAPLLYISRRYNACRGFYLYHSFLLRFLSVSIHVYLVRFLSVSVHVYIMTLSSLHLPAIPHLSEEARRQGGRGVRFFV